MNQGSRSARGFTLLELLVVVAVIMLLTSMLVPSLGSARDKAKQVVCLSRLKSLGQVAIEYGLDYDDAIPGSPLTSGMHFTQTPGYEVWKPGDSVSDWYDFAGAVLPRLTKSIPQERPKLISRLTQKEFACPSNQETYGPYPQVEGYPVIQAVSYLTMNTFMRAGPGHFYDFIRNPPKGVTLDELWKITWPDTYTVQMPERYVPRFAKVGKESLKVLLADGFRYFAPPATMDYCIYQKSFAGNQSAQPPCDIDSREYSEGKGGKLSYRHGKDDTINAVFFDGHAEGLAKKASRRPDHYFPTGSLVVDEGGFYVEWHRGNDIRLP